MAADQLRPTLRLAAATCVVLAVPVGGATAEAPGAFSLGLGLGTLGPTIEGSYRITDAFGLRVPAGFLSTAYDERVDDIDFDVDLDIGGIGLLGDYRPAGGVPGLDGLRLSAGGILGAYALDARGRGDGEVGDNDYEDVDLRLGIDPRNRLMPVVAVGYDGALTRRWRLSADLGAIFAGGFDLDLRDASGQVSEADLETEIGEIEDDLPALLPYVTLSVAFRF